MRELARLEGMRALAWAGDVLYASRGYEVVRARVAQPEDGTFAPAWEPVGEFQASLCRRATSRARLASRLMRDGFHALAIHPSGTLVGAVPGAIATCAPEETRFRTTHAISRGTRPLNIAVTPSGHFFWGEYFDNPARLAVHIYSSEDVGQSWRVAYTFPAGSIRHVHSVVYDRWRDCLWILTGDYGGECRILQAKCDLSEVRTILSGNQQARAVACIPAQEGLYFSTDTPLEANFICRLSDDGAVVRLASISSSSIDSCRTRSGMFFSTMVEPSEVNRDPQVRIYGSRNGQTWAPELAWRKDRWPMRFFQYGNAFFPGGENSTEVLAVTTVAVDGADGRMSLYAVAE